MLSAYDGEIGDVMNAFFDNYEKTVKEHFEYEERVLFPYTTALVYGIKAGTVATPQEGYGDHTDIEDCIHDFRNLILKHIPSKGGEDARIEVISHIFRLEEDMHRHVMIEDRLLLPLIKKLEGRE